MAGLRTLYGNDAKTQPGLKSNFDVDYVIHYKIPVPEAERAEAEAAFVQLVKGLANVGFATEVRNGGKDSLLVFTKIASDRLLHDQVYRYRVQDWLYGVRVAAPNQDLAQYFQDEPVSEAERLRLTYLLITKPKNEGGAGITPKMGQWKNVASIFPLHDHAFNSHWIKQWSTKYYLDDGDINQIRDRFGERVAFYFAFLQSYFAFLLFPAAFGAAAWLVLGQFSWFYAIVNCLWSVVFFEHWKMKEVDLAVQWGVRGVSKIQHPRPQFQFEREAQDPVTGEIIKVYPHFKRFRTQLLQVPFALACVGVLGGLIVSCFSIEIFITEIYTGPFKQYLTFLPTVLLTIFMPTLSALLTQLAERLTTLENYETHDDHQASFVQKIFVLNFITSYTPIFLTAFIYVPFGKILVPYLDVFQLTAQKFTTQEKPLPTKSWEMNPDRLTKQVIYFTVTAQIVNFATEVIVPYVKRKVFKTVEDVKSEMSEKNADIVKKDVEEEADFLARVRNEAELDEYDVTVDYREMVIQFGYLALFSVVWPLTACSFLVNNWVEARSDAVKIAISSQRPIPWRADSIGPWLNALGFLSWLGSVTSAAIVFLFHRSEHGPNGSPWDISGWALLLSILFAEHVYLAVQFLVRHVIHKMDSPGLQKERAQRFRMRKQLLETTFGAQQGHDAQDETNGPGLSGGEKITRETLEEEARQLSIKGSGSPEQLFWQRQRGPSETIQIGRNLFSEIAANQTKHKTAKE
ncbi:calcium-activated chloride channel-domain-containing protein [Apodospora peruviana]|uniref:Calcium-activated chloride channel-domain-containing protein n=1 Tax=Apodospora peruviana TaxID=516989 RepID=A0AAE0M4G8_9PEZI|nr:calcium-activated chloride channel-domain-containing protein [Apodospora peruviana]